MRFCLNVDHVAFLRNARGEKNPDPVTFALLAEEYGVDGIVVHLREDRRHIKERDLLLLRQLVTTKLDLEMAADEEIVKIACEVKPELATIVPEKREELTTEGGLDVIKHKDHLKKVTEELQNSGIAVSFFIEPALDQIAASVEAGADFIEFHTGVYANAESMDDRYEELERIRMAARFAREKGLGVNAGHGLNYHNLADIAEIEEIEEVSIGQAVVAHSLFVGLEKAVKEILAIVK